MFRALSLIAATSYATLAVGAGAAWANGDPPSNVLLNQPVYFPADAGGTNPLTGTVNAAGRAGYDVKVALIQSPRDLGNIPQYWGQPQAYADHLADGIRFAWRGDLLIVMPAGFGVAAGAQAAKKKAALGRLPQPGNGVPSLARAGDRAVRALAQAAGRPIGSGGGSVLPALGVLGGLLLVGGAAAVWRVRSAPPQAPGGEPEREGDLGGVEQRPE